MTVLLYSIRMGIGADLGQEIAELSARLDAATHRLLTCIRQFDEQCGWGEQGAVSCAHWLSWRIGLDLATAREKVRVARALGTLPAIDGALAAGKLSYAKVRALSRVATPDNEAKLLEMALYATGAQLERICRGFRTAQIADEDPTRETRSVRRRLLPSGMVKLGVVLCPDEADLVMRAIERAREVGHSEEQPHVSEERSEEPSESSQWPSRADGVVALAENYLAGNVASGNGGQRFQVTVHVDQDPLAADGVLAATLEDGTNVSAETLRRVACDCGLVAVTGAGESLNIGRRTRSIPPAIRRVRSLRNRPIQHEGQRRPSPRRWPPSLLYFAGAGTPTSTFAFTPLRYSTFKLYFAAASGSLACKARAALDDVFQDEVEAALGFTEGAVVVGQAGDGGLLGATVGLEGAQLGFELGLEVFAGADGGRGT